MAENPHEKYPVTLAIRFLQDHGVEFERHLFEYEEKGGTAVSSRKLGISEHAVIKTLIMETDKKEPLVVLMHGDYQVSTKGLARAINVKSVSPCRPDVAHKHTGYIVGGTSPFGTKKAMSVFMEESILELDRIYINGGQRGYLVSMKPQEIVRLLKPDLVTVGIIG